jgi:5'-3' exoribonuclease 1
MGIPSYFSYILRKHPYIVTKITTADNLYIDSNSIIYDMASTLENTDNFESKLIIRRVCEKIEYYLNLIQPKRVIIAFDGVPPMAKIKQQRERRYKSWILQRMSGVSTSWNTIQITPGTAFMKELDIALHSYFKNYEKKYEYFKLSTSTEEGEGEHKIFSFIRENPDMHKEQNTLVYGLDSDLIVLSLNHLTYGSIKLLREAPAFMLDDRELHVLDVPKLAEGIKEIIGETKLPDYIFMTLLLGNDFMPHFPALNLRTTGFDTLLQTYKESILPQEKLFDGEIQWTVFRKFITALSEKEHSIIIKEYNARNRWRVDTSSEEKKINNTPLLKREKEHFICPIKPGWEKRYYDSLFNQPMIKDICKNYTDMLCWNMNYYTTGCTDWTLKYEYMYPPLLIDLVNHIPETSWRISGSRSITYRSSNFTSKELLYYVLPPHYYYYIPMESSKESVCPTLEWSYCKYIWESHVKF